MAKNLFSTASDSDARLMNVIGQPKEAGFKLIRAWPWLAGNASAAGGDINSLITGMNTCLVLRNPKANHDSYAGTFVVSENRASDENENGTADRACTIIQTLTRVKLVTDVASLGNPDKGADRTTLNFLGFREGEEFHVYHKYKNLDPNSRATCVGVDGSTGLSPTESGFTIVQRKFEVEADKTGTFYVVFQKDHWLTGPVTAKWTTHRKLLGRDNYHTAKPREVGLVEHRQVTGLSKGAYDSAFLSAMVNDTNRVVASVRLSEREHGEYVVEQSQRIKYSGTADSDATIELIRDDQNGLQTGMLRRIWPRRSEPAKDSLVTSTGNARTNYTYDNTSYVHSDVSINDNGDGTWDVTQILADLDATEIGVGLTYFDTVYTLTKVQTRTRDEKKKTFTYSKHLAMKPTEHSAKDFIASRYGTASSDPKYQAHVAVYGTDRVVKKGVYAYEASVITHNPNLTPEDANGGITHWL